MPAKPPSTQLATYERRLDNGLTAIVREDPANPVAAVVTHVQAGYFDEPDELVGISHVLEHMYFKGTERRGVGDMARETKALGGYLNAGTIYDYTTYYTVLPAPALDLALDIQADALRHSVIDESELERELGVIVEEAKRKLDNPAAVATESLYNTMFDVHRMRRWRIGTEEGLRRLTRADVLGFYRSRYVPERIIVVVAGNVRAGEAFDAIERLYADMPRGAPPGAVEDRGPEEPERSGLRFRRLEGDIVQTHLEWGWRTPATLHPETPALDLLAVHLGQGRASRLWREVREEGLVTSVSAYNYTPTRLGVFGISAELPHHDARAALEAIHACVERVRLRPPRPEEVDRARNIAEARVLARLETAEGQARDLAHWQALGDWRLGERYFERILEATPEELHRAAQRHLGLERAAVLLYEREGEPGHRWTPAGLEAMLAGAVPVEARPEEAPAEAEPSIVGGAVSAVAGPVAVEVEESVRFYELSGGLRLVVEPRPASSMVALAVCCRGGRVNERPQGAGLTGMMARTAVKGTELRDAAELAQLSEALGGALGYAVGADLFSWTFDLPARHARAGVELLLEVAFQPSFPAAELDRERKVVLDLLGQIRDDMYRYPMRLFFQAAFAGHPYGFTLEESERAVRGIEREAVAAWHRRHLFGGRPTLLAVGGVDPDALARTVEERISALGVPPGDEPAGKASPPGWPEGMVVEEVGRDKAQTALVLGFPGPTRSSADIYPLQVLSSVLSGLGGRLFEEVRDRRSLAYSVTAYPVARWLSGAFVVYVATSPEREEEAREAIMGELERAARDPVPEEELERARSYRVGTWSIQRQSNGARLGHLADALLLGSGVEELREYESRIRAVDADGALAAFGRCFRPERMVQGIVRGRAPGLEG